MVYSSNKQTIANRKWQQKNKEKQRYLSSRSNAKSFIINYATLEDLDELFSLLMLRENELSMKGDLK